MVEEPKGWNEKLSYDFLIECAKNDKIDEWNMAYEAYLRYEWVRLFPSEMYDLENIGKLFCDDVGFERLEYKGKSFNDDISDGADFSNAHLEGVDFSYTHLDVAKFEKTYLKGAEFFMSHLKDADFSYAHLENADFCDAHLEGAELSYAHLEGAIFINTDLKGAIFNLAVVNGETQFTYSDKPIDIDRRTDFTGTSLSSARILPELRTKLERNIRQIHWEHWYKDNKLLEIPTRAFWNISDYGTSACVILFTFIFSNFIFTMFYLALRDAGLLDGSILSSGNDLLLAYMQTTLVPFGILGIDLTTLSLFPVFIIFVQVIFGYTILAALVTRMAIMFQNLSP